MECPDCDSVDRRRFLKTAALEPPAPLGCRGAQRLTGASSETLVTTLYKSLTPEQKPKIAFPFDHPLRSKVDNNWHIMPMKSARSSSPDQQAMIEEIFRGLHNPEFVDKVIAHMEEDTRASAWRIIRSPCSASPAPGAFEFVLTGRHCTARCDGDSVEGAAFGGPIFYGHRRPDLRRKARPSKQRLLVSGQARQRGLSGPERKTARSRPCWAIRAPRRPPRPSRCKKKGELAGIPVADMSRDQKHLVDKVLADLLMPFRKKDADEAMRYIEGSGGVDELHMSFYKNLDIGNDGVWDVWQLESPNMVWYFRGAPHVHTWVNIRAKA